jgi:transcriptional regulator with XRE-family HTH domain
MYRANHQDSLDLSRKKITKKVHELRKLRRWTQAELAQRLGLSQNRLSEIERGGGSFTAEQFLHILRVFNVAITEFDQGPPDRDLEVQNALARLGAKHLQESEQVLVRQELEDINTAIQEALLLGVPRLVTAVAPVLVAHAEHVALDRLYANLEKTGHERRLAWVVANTLEALEALANSAETDANTWAKLYRRAGFPLRTFLFFAGLRREQATEHPDLLDATIRSQRTLDDVQHRASASARDWGIATSLQREDFVHALRSARAAS